MAVGIIIAIAVVLAIVLVVMGRRSSSNGAAATAARASDEDLATFRLDPVDFHVDGETAVVSFDVAASRVSEDDVMKDLLVRQAIEAVRDRQARGLPIGDPSSVRVLATEGGGFVEVAEADLGEPGTAAFPDAHDPEPRDADEVPVDPLHRFASLVETRGGGTSYVSRRDDLADLGSELRLTSELRDALEANGVDLGTLDASTLTRELLAVAGYSLRPGDAPGTYTASRQGVETFVALVDHAPGEYPELSEQAISAFLAGFYSSRASKGLLFSDKFGPHLVYEKERRDQRVRFITRERMQDFVDSIAAL